MDHQMTEAQLNWLSDMIFQYVAKSVHAIWKLPAPAPVVTLERYTPTTSLDGLSEFSIENFILPTL